MRSADAVRARFSHLPAAESILNGAEKLRPEMDVADLQVVALKCVILLKEEHEKYGKINILVHHRLIEFSNLFSILPETLSKNIESILIDTYGDNVLCYLTQTITE